MEKPDALSIRTEWRCVSMIYTYTRALNGQHDGGEWTHKLLYRYLTNAILRVILYTYTHLVVCCIYVYII